MPPPATDILFLSRQRLAGATNGSSTYLLAIADALRAAGFVPHLVQPSPTMMGRWPVMRLRPEMRVFASHRVRGVGRVGDTLVSRDPRVYAAVLRAIVSRAARRLGIAHRWARDRPAPYAISLPWTKADAAFLRRAARDRGAIVIADYMFQAGGFASLPSPPRATAIVMHDLFHTREATDGGGRSLDTVATVTRADEIAMLARADAVIAIQAAEARFVDEHVPGVRAILAPMATPTVVLPQPGGNGAMLFVGSNTAPNVVGLRWLFQEIWPRIRAGWPDARLDIAGSVATAFARGGPEGIRFLGLVDDLGPVYAAADLVVSPLTFGSGLKIKLIEAMGRGKAIVATGVTLQGVERQCAGAVARADDPAAFADAVLALHRDPDARAALAAAALTAARRHFSRDACYGELVAWVRGVAGAA